MEPNFTATAANDYRHSIGLDYCLAEVMGDEEFLDVEPAEDEAERQRVNQFMFDYFYG